ncbi:MAG: hypothetical protein ABI895_41060 [Deltaproteobacteria bacterium]
MEQVVVHSVDAGTVEITVRAFRAATSAQSFALVFSAKHGHFARAG